MPEMKTYAAIWFANCKEPLVVELLPKPVAVPAKRSPSVRPADTAAATDPSPEPVAAMGQLPAPDRG